MKEEELKQIDDYFQLQSAEAERIEFEKRIGEDKEFADLVAFYTYSKAIVREKLLKNRHAEWNSQKGGNQINFFPKIIVGIAASLLLLVGFWYFGQNYKKNYKELAKNYIQTELLTLPMKMDANTDSLELGKKLYNEKKYKEAFALFDKLQNPEAKQYQGLSSLQSGDYLTAITIFEKQAQNQELLNNKAKFYLSLTYLKNGETAKGEAILKEVIAENLAGKIEAEKLLE